MVYGIPAFLYVLGNKISALLEELSVTLGFVTALRNVISSETQTVSAAPQLSVIRGMRRAVSTDATVNFCACTQHDVLAIHKAGRPLKEQILEVIRTHKPRMAYQVHLNRLCVWVGPATADVRVVPAGLELYPCSA